MHFGVQFVLSALSNILQHESWFFFRKSGTDPDRPYELSVELCPGDLVIGESLSPQPGALSTSANCLRDCEIDRLRPFV